MIRVIFSIVLSIIPAYKAAAFCLEPSPPDAVAMMKPNIPFCLSNYKFSDTHECSQWELDRYRDDANNYIQQLNQYVRDSVVFANEAQVYAKCLADEVKMN